MSSMLTGVTVAVLGGDDRELFLVTQLVRMGALVRAAGNTKLAGIKNVSYYETAQQAAADARIVILPMPGIDDQGVVRASFSDQPVVLNEDTVGAFQNNCIIIVGFARKKLQDLAAKRGIKLVEIADMDHVAILNSIPTGEGALQMAMQASDITIHGSTSLVLGFGRCGSTLARMLHALGAKTVVAARKPADLARVREIGMEPLNFSQLAERIGEADFIFNTVPLLVLNSTLLAQVKPDAYICDIASSPGGVDYAAAKRLGLKAELAPALPGKVAPRTAGQVLAQVVPEIIAHELAKPPSTLGETESGRGC